MKSKLINFLLCGMLLTGCATAGAELHAAAKQEYAQLPVEHFLKSLTVKDDELETSAQFSTYKGYIPEIPLDPYLALLASSNEGFKNDEFMRAYVFKGSGKEVYQMYFLLRANGWRRPTSINFSAGLGSRTTERIGIDVKCYSSYCNHDEDVIVNFTKDELEQVVTTLDSSSESLLRFRIKGQAGQDYDGSFSVNEVKAILLAVENYKAKN